MCAHDFVEMKHAEYPELTEDELKAEWKSKVAGTGALVAGDAEAACVPAASLETMTDDPAIPDGEVLASPADGDIAATYGEAELDATDAAVSIPVATTGRRRKLFVLADAIVDRRSLQAMQGGNRRLQKEIVPMSSGDAPGMLPTGHKFLNPHDARLIRTGCLPHQLSFDEFAAGFKQSMTFAESEQAKQGGFEQAMSAMSNPDMSMSDVENLEKGLGKMVSDEVVFAPTGTARVAKKKRVITLAEELYLLRNNLTTTTEPPVTVTNTTTTLPPTVKPLS